MTSLILPPGVQRPFRQCQASGCLSRAQFVPKLCVPPKGFPIEANKHLSLICGLPLCEDHLVSLQPEQLLNRHTRPVIDNFCRGKVPPDYQRAFILPVPMESDEYRTWEKQKRKGRTQ